MFQPPGPIQLNLQWSSEIRSEIHVFLESILKNLDLFISVSNSTAHLAASLGVKTLLVRPEKHALFHYCWTKVIF